MNKTFSKITEQDSLYRHLDKMSTTELLNSINTEDQKVAIAVRKIIPEVEALVNTIVSKMDLGGRLFYIGAGTSGRLGVVDASECPPTFGVPFDWVIGIMAGGDEAIRKSKEFAEDSDKQAWMDLQEWKADSNDVVVGIAASGTTPYVVHGLAKCQSENIITGSICCNPGSPITEVSDHPLVAVVGPEFVTGSTRMKSGTAQKLLLNMISTSVMIKLGRVKDNKMVDMQLSNNKLLDRGTKMVQQKLGVSYEKASELLSKHKSVRLAIENGT